MFGYALLRIVRALFVSTASGDNPDVDVSLQSHVNFYKRDISGVMP